MSNGLQAPCEPSPSMGCSAETTSVSTPAKPGPGFQKTEFGEEGMLRAWDRLQKLRKIIEAFAVEPIRRPTVRSFSEEGEILAESLAYSLAAEAYEATGFGQLRRWNRIQTEASRTSGGFPGGNGGLISSTLIRSFASMVLSVSGCRPGCGPMP